MTKEKKVQKKNTKKKIKLETPMIVMLVILLIITIASYFIFNITFTLILILGLVVILGVSYLLRKIRMNKVLRRVLNIILILLFIIAIFVCIVLIGFVGKIIKEAPEFDITKLTKQEASIFYANDGVTEIGRVGAQLRENVTYDDLPEVFIDALIATEDSRYFQHNGFDAPRFVKASIGQLMGNKDAGGASTLSMQVITNNFTDPNRVNDHGIDGIIRKFTDIYLAVFKLEKNYTKEQIIEFYVNNHELSNNAWGVEQASQTYFGKSVRDLNLSEAALLVGMFNNPTAFNPYKNPYSASKRRAQVLNLMVKHGYITLEEANLANDIPVSSLLNGKSSYNPYQAYIDTVTSELMEKHGINPKTTPVLVYTNIDMAKQKGIEDIMNGNGAYKWLNDVVTSGVAVVESKTGKIVAIGAGHNRVSGGWNTATQERRQIGSTAKPIFDYGPAIEYLGWNTYHQILDEPWAYSTGQSINNSDGQFRGWMSMRYALAQSRNIPALKTFQEVQDTVGNQKIVEFATGLGLTPEVAPNGTIYESHALGAFSGATPLEMAAAYAAFANGGTYYEPTTISKIVYRENNDVKTIKVQGVKAMSESTAFMITDMLVSAVESGVSNAAKINGVHIAAKTGTTNFDPAKKQTLSGDAINDSWIVGYDPEYTMSMWYGYSTPTKEYHNHEWESAVQRGLLYKALGNVVFEKNGKDFKAPNSIKRVCVEQGSNPPALPSANTPQDQITCEYFINGAEPTEVSSKFDKLETVSNLKVTYNESTKKVVITWSRLNSPTANENFGSFGYNVYYGDVLLDFTTENSYTIEANANISGTYKVVTTFEKYNGNQSEPAVYDFQYIDPNATPEPTPTPIPTPTPTPTPEVTPTT